MEQKTVIVTGASSGVGLNGAKALADKGWHVIMALPKFRGKPRRSPGKLVCPRAATPSSSWTWLPWVVCASSSATFALRARSLESLVCNASGVLPSAERTHLQRRWLRSQRGHQPPGPFPAVQSAAGRHEKLPRPATSALVILGTGPRANPKELGGKIPIPAPPDLGNLEGFEGGLQSSHLG